MFAYILDALTCSRIALIKVDFGKYPFRHENSFFELSHVCQEKKRKYLSKTA